jgi:catechol 2,3-dioxygenase-like lactoylglutathione lyase family enzyme
MKSFAQAVLVVVGLALVATPRATAQLAAPGESGVVMGHVHLTVRDLDAHQRFWTTLGGVPVQNGPLRLIEFPGVYIMLTKGEPTEGTYGSIVNHIGFLVKDLPESVARWKAAGVRTEPSGSATQTFVVAPDNVRLEILQDKTIDTPIKMHHIHFFTTAPLEMQAWYAKMLGARPGTRGRHDAGDLPGVNLTFTKAEFSEQPLPRSPTKGRSLDHIGFEVKNLEQLCKELEAAGVALDRPYHRVPNSTVSVAFITDPWGTNIELTENLAPSR